MPRAGVVKADGVSIAPASSQRTISWRGRHPRGAGERCLAEIQRMHARRAAASRGGDSLDPSILHAGRPHQRVPGCENGHWSRSIPSGSREPDRIPDRHRIFLFAMAARFAALGRASHLPQGSSRHRCDGKRVLNSHHSLPGPLDPHQADRAHRSTVRAEIRQREWMGDSRQKALESNFSTIVAMT